MNKQLTLEALQEKLIRAKEHNRKIYEDNRTTNKLFAAELADMFSTLEFMKLSIRVDDNRAYFSTRPEGDDKYGKDLFEIYYSRSFLTKNEVITKDNFQLSYYSTTCIFDNELEINRMIAIGKIAEKTKDQAFVDRLIKHFTDITNYQTQNSVPEYKIEDEINKLECSIKQDALDELKVEGAVYKFPKLTNLYVNNRDWHRCTKVEVVKINKKSIKFKFYQTKEDGSERLLDEANIYGEHPKGIFKAIQKALAEEA